MTTPPTEAEALLGCPFCGNEDITFYSFANKSLADVAADCRKCGAHGPIVAMPSQNARNAWNTRALTQRSGWRDIEAESILKRISELLACSVGGGVHFAVEPELSSVKVMFAKRNEVHEFSDILTDLHPVDEEGCFVHKRPLPPSAAIRALSQTPPEAKP